MKRLLALGVAIAPLAMTACSSDSGNTGTVQVFIEAEDTIPDGLQPGTEGDSIQDGWTVTYDRFIVTAGNFHAARSSTPSDVLRAADVYVLDMKALPAGGFVLTTFNDVDASRWDKVGFSLANATSASKKADFTSQADFDMMVSNHWSIYVEATMTKADGQSCLPTNPTSCVAAPSIKLTFGLTAGTSFDDCADEDGLAGFAVPTGGTVQVKPTIHGDHWFFTNITQGAEITERRAQWIANADLDRDHVVTLDEAAMSSAGNLFPNPPYNLSGAIITVTDGKDYIEAQSRTLGDYNGDGECPTRTILP
jgi:hypothetical protein